MTTLSRLSLLLAATATAAPLTAQNNGLPSQSQSAVLMEVIATRGEQCELMRPWQAASLRMQTDDLRRRLPDSTQQQIQREVEQRTRAMACDDPLLVEWTTAAVPTMEREYLPELLSAYRALATMSPRPALFDSVTGRTDYPAMIARIDAKLVEMVAAGVRLPGGMTLDSLHQRQAGFARQIGAALAGQDDAGRITDEQARRMVMSVGRITELWARAALAERAAGSPR